MITSRNHRPALLDARDDFLRSIRHVVVDGYCEESRGDVRVALVRMARDRDRERLGCMTLGGVAHRRSDGFGGLWVDVRVPGHTEIEAEPAPRRSISPFTVRNLDSVVTRRDDPIRAHAEIFEKRSTAPPFSDRDEVQ